MEDGQNVKFCISCCVRQHLIVCATFYQTQYTAQCIAGASSILIKTGGTCPPPLLLTPLQCSSTVTLKELKIGASSVALYVGAWGSAMYFYT